jgi:hypothetical protein
MEQDFGRRQWRTHCVRPGSCTEACAAVTTGSAVFCCTMPRTVSPHHSGGISRVSGKCFPIQGSKHRNNQRLISAAWISLGPNSVCTTDARSLGTERARGGQRGHSGARRYAAYLALVPGSNVNRKMARNMCGYSGNM